MKAALYLRISQDRTGEHLGVDRQREDCLELANTLGWDIAETYVDNDKSAYKNRPAYERMLVDIDAGQIDAIVVWHSDRLYRVVKDLGRLIDICKASNTQIATVRMGAIDLTTPTGRLVAGLMAQVATYEGEAKSDRWKRSWRQGREAGKWAQNGNRCYGYTDDGQIIPEEQAVARWMAAEITSGKPILTVARELDARGILTSYGNPWSPQTIKRYLTNPRIAGWASIGRMEDSPNVNPKTGEPFQHKVYDILGSGTWEPLIDRETWEAVAAFLNSRTRPYVPRKSILTRLIRCGACGHLMITSSAKGNRTYRCPNRPNMPGCGKVSGRADYIEDVVESYAKTRLTDPRVRKHIAELRAEGDGGPRAELAAIELRLTELEAQLDDPAIPLASINRAIERAHDKQAELRNQIVARSGVIIPSSDAEWPEGIAERRQLVDLVVEDVALEPATKASVLGFDTERVRIEPRI